MTDAIDSLSGEISRRKVSLQQHFRHIAQGTEIRMNDTDILAHEAKVFVDHFDVAAEIRVLLKRRLFHHLSDVAQAIDDATICLEFVVEEQAEQAANEI